MLSSGSARVYTLTSIDAAARAATSDALVALATIAFGSFVLAAIGSFWLARMLTQPINQRVERDCDDDGRARFRADAGADRHEPGARRADVCLQRSDARSRGGGSGNAIRVLGAIRALAAALDARDPYTAGHSERVSTLSVMMGRTMNLASNDLEILRLGALLHDIGKIGVSDEILRKTGPLTPEEFEQIKRHPALGARILRQVPFLAPHLPIVELHHERPDGRGYPFGLRGDADPAGRAHRSRRRRIRRDDQRACLSRRASRFAGVRRARALLGDAVRSGMRRGAARRHACLARHRRARAGAAARASAGVGMRNRFAPWIVVLLTAAPAAAQRAQPSVLSIDSAADVDVTVDADGNQVTGVFLDSLVVADFAHNIQAMVRPQVQRLAASGRVEPANLGR